MGRKKRKRGTNPERYHRPYEMRLADMMLAANAEQLAEETNGGFRGELLRAVRHAVQSELTQRQQRCFTLFYEEGLTIRQIARRLEVCDSTVSRHVAAARGKVRRYASYCAFGHAPGGQDGETRFLHGG